MKKAQTAEITYLEKQHKLEIKKVKEAADLEITKTQRTMSALG